MSLLSGIVLALVPGAVVRGHGEGVKPNPLREENERLKREVADLKERLSVAEGTKALLSNDVDTWRDRATAAQRALADRVDERLSQAAAALIDSGRLPYREPSEALVELLNQQQMDAHRAVEQYAQHIVNPLTQSQHQQMMAQAQCNQHFMGPNPNNLAAVGMQSFHDWRSCTCVPGRSALFTSEAWQ